ncbi:hypothetical protein EG68_03289 [Paragonimus skrjabini miyazakii]|uniref:Uncharacterized protein n=1 Tax=Paragonimus skrjabini miyazakii TaxID=59628 RepID=A0A8S9YVX4_9TREM|nr:hypothetical protein EG68_03289 [Paragonimus skrjabini miyazakii]
MEHRVYDLDVPFKTANPTLIARILDAGYHCIALSQSVTIDDFNFSLKTNEDFTRKKTKEERQSMRISLIDQLRPPPLETLNGLLSDSQKYRAINWSPTVFFTPRLFRRLNLHCSEPSLAGLFFREFGEMLNQFDIISFCPSSAEALAYACEHAPSLDLITVNLSNPSELRLTNKQCSVVISRGLRLEFQLSPLLHSGSSGSLARTNLAHYLINLFSGVRPSFNKAIVISSGATIGWEVRRPLAVVALLQCLGLQPKEVARSALTKGPYAVVAHGLSRSRMAHGAAALLKLLSNPSVISIENIEPEVIADVTDSPPKKKSCA